MDAWRIFGLDEANRLVPLLRSTFDQVAPVADRLRAVGRQAQAGDAEAAGERAQLLKQLEVLLAPLIDLGIEVKAIEGLVDFHSRRDGRVVYLCWKYPEDEIRWWHELDAGFAGRRPIDAREAFDASYLC